MKKYMMSMVIIMMFLLTAAGPKKTLVVYYSRDGHTHSVAEKIAAKVGADMERLQDLKDRSGALGQAAAGKDAIAKNLTELAPLTRSVDEYDTVIVGTPGWMSNMTPAVRTFLTQYALGEKDVHFFATCHRVGAGKAIDQMESLVFGDQEHVSQKLPLTHADMEGDAFESKLNMFTAAIMAENKE